MTDPAIARRSRVTVDVGLDDQHNPVAMEWTAEDAGQPGPRACRSFLLALWDDAEANTSLLHLWTRQMRVDDMHRFIHQMLLTLGDSYGRATSRPDLARALHEFGEELLQFALHPAPGPGPEPEPKAEAEPGP